MKPYNNINNSMNDTEELNRKIEAFRNTIWITRISRVKAEERLMDKESFSEWLNIYYSCITVILSIILLEFSQYKALSYGNIAITICLLVSILYFKSLKFKEQALTYRKNYTDLYRLELSLTKGISEEKFKEIQNQYCDAIEQCNNHKPFDYYKTILDSKPDFRKKYFTHTLLFKYYFNILWRMLIKLCLIALPILIIMLCIHIDDPELYKTLNFANLYNIIIQFFIPASN